MPQLVHQQSSGRSATDKASNVVSRIRAKLTRRRHSFTASFTSSRSSLKSHGPSQSQSQSVHSRSATPSQPPSQQRHHDLASLASSTSSSDSSTSSTGQGNDKQQPQQQQQQQQLLQPDTSSDTQEYTSDSVTQNDQEKSIGDANAQGGPASESKDVEDWRQSLMVQGSGPDRQPATVISVPPSAAAAASTAVDVGGPPEPSDLQSPPASQQAANKPSPPSLPRQHSWQYHRPSSQQLQSIDEISGPPSPTTVTSTSRVPDAKPVIADSVLTSTTNAADDEDNHGDNDDDTDDNDANKKAVVQRANSQHLALTLTRPSNPNTPAAADSPSLQYFHVKLPPRRQSLLSQRQSSLIKTLLDNPSATDDEDDTGSILPLIDIEAEMTTRKIWVKRPGASPTLIAINEDDLVDDVRDLILRKYSNSLGKTFDSPDLTLRIMPREPTHKERLLGPEEPMCRTLDAYFPGGQAVAEALIIDIPARRTPRPSPRAHTSLYATEDGRPSEAGEGYFPPVAVGGIPSPHHGVVVQAPASGMAPHSIAVLGTGHIPAIPSPGAIRPRHERSRTDRPRLNRQHTSSPTIIGNGGHSSQATASGADGASHGMSYVSRPSHSRAHSNASDQQKGVAALAQPGSPGNSAAQQARVATPPPRVTSPRPSANRIRKTKRNSEHPSLPTGMLNGSVPPISVLIVEDNPINLKLLEAFVKRLKVRWSTAMNGRDAVKKWRSGGFHLVLMDIQLPVMNGLDATREIRRLERVNHIGVFTSSPTSMPEEVAEDEEELKEQDRLDNMSLFKSPVIIVALTASSLQSDRHEALAAGCNDFLTKVRDELALDNVKTKC
jgi:osomolarity two-component system, response regulator SSK1